MTNKNVEFTVVVPKIKESPAAPARQMQFNLPDMTYATQQMAGYDKGYPDLIMEIIGHRPSRPIIYNIKAPPVKESRPTPNIIYNINPGTPIKKSPPAPVIHYRIKGLYKWACFLKKQGKLI
jgi:hypothetical protein